MPKIIALIKSHFMQDHNRYCQSVRYSPDGNFWASAGFDGKIFLYEGKESELICEIQEGDQNAHGGGIYALSWSGNSKSFLSCSGDKTCKIWDVETKKSTTTFSMGNNVEDQQVGCLWSGNFLLSGRFHVHLTQVNVIRIDWRIQRILLNNRKALSLRYQSQSFE
jgi:WD40 repeat protein